MPKIFITDNGLKDTVRFVVGPWIGAPYISIGIIFAKKSLLYRMVDVVPPSFIALLRRKIAYWALSTLFLQAVVKDPFCRNSVPRYLYDV